MTVNDVDLIIQPINPKAAKYSGFHKATIND